MRELFAQLDTTTEPGEGGQDLEECESQVPADWDDWEAA